MFSCVGSANEDKQAAVARTLYFPRCSIILPREEFQPLHKDPHQSCPGGVTELGHGNAVGPQEGPSVLKVFLDSKSPFVHQRVVPRAQQHEVLEICFNTSRPVFDMVVVQKPSIMAARKGAAVTVPRP